MLLIHKIWAEISNAKYSLTFIRGLGVWNREISA